MTRMGLPAATNRFITAAAMSGALLSCRRFLHGFWPRPCSVDDGATATEHNVDSGEALFRDASAKGLAQHDGSG
jgi:hypothetical protein